MKSATVHVNQSGTVRVPLTRKRFELFDPIIRGRGRLFREGTYEVNAERPISALEVDVLRAIRHRGSHTQIIACAGSGKTEVVAQRVANLLADGADARSIIAFAFTERAAGNRGLQDICRSGSRCRHALQLAVYADAGRREGLDVRAAYVHDLKDAARDAVDVTPTAIVAAEGEVESAVSGLRKREFHARPGGYAKGSTG